MRSLRVRAVVFALVLIGSAAFVFVPQSLSSSDGYAGGTLQVPEHLRKCAEGFKCKVRVSACGSCHGVTKDMQTQRDTEFPVTDRIAAKILINDNDEFWEYTPGQRYFFELTIVFPNGHNDPDRQPDARPIGFGAYSKGGFTINASEGQFISLNDKVRVTGGIYNHEGSRNEEYWYDTDGDGQGDTPYGAFRQNETRQQGEATHTYEGSLARSWTFAWDAPVSMEPNGVAIMASVMVPNGDGFDNCVYVECNITKGYSEQALWDWWSSIIQVPSSSQFDTPHIPRAYILCEEGAYATTTECRDAVLESVLPPTPTVDINAEPSDDPFSDNGDGSTTPGLSLPLVITVVGLIAAAGVARRRK